MCARRSTMRTEKVTCWASSGHDKDGYIAPLGFRADPTQTQLHTYACTDARTLARRHILYSPDACASAVAHMGPIPPTRALPFPKAAPKGSDACASSSFTFLQNLFRPLLIIAFVFGMDTDGCNGASKRA